MNPAPKFVLYHGNCPDGFTAAWAAWRALGDESKYIPVVYGRPIPQEVLDCPAMGIVYIVDFSYPRDVLLSLHEKHVVRVLDHHKTAQADPEGLKFCTFDVEKSGAMLAWEYFHERKTPPRLVQYAQDRDLWRWQLPSSKEVSAYYMSYEYDFEKWDEIAEELQSNLPYCIAEGAAILRAKDQMVTMMANQAFFREIGGHKVPVANATVAFSEVGNKLCEMYPNAPFAGYFFMRKDGKTHWGLRSIGEFDVSEIAKLYGGGGHRNAAGYVTDLEEA